jgi:hypothetical protein
MLNPRFRRLEALAEERNKSESDMAKILSDRGIAVVDGLYDGILFEAVFTAPSKSDGGLSPRTGIGAVQSLVEQHGIRVLVHDANRSQTIVFRKGSKNVVARWQYVTQGGNVTKFNARGFLHEDSHPYYLFTNFDGPTAWVLSTAQLMRMWKKLKDGTHNPNDNSARIPPDGVDHEYGYIQLRLENENNRYLLKSPYQLGL